MQLDEKIIEENILIALLFESQLTLVLKNDKLFKEMEVLKNRNPEKQITVFLCGLSDYYKTNPKGKECLETKLMKLQLFLNVQHRIIENATDLSTTICQFTKSVSEIPYK